MRRPLRPRVLRTALAALAFGAGALAGCAWIGLAWGALRYPTTRAGEPANVVIAGDFAYATRGAVGIEIVRLGRGAELGERRMLRIDGGSVDDLAVADGLLFALDARPPGALRVFSLANPAAPEASQPAVPVEVGPFSGVSAAAGRVVVSGGTSRLSLREYTRDGRLGPEVATADLGRGQPDVLVAPDGRHAFVSAHVFGPHFELRAVELVAPPLRVVPRGSVPLDTFGFTRGGSRPASFPIECALDGATLYVAHAAGLARIDVSDPGVPRLLTVQEVGVEPVNVDVRDGLAAVVGSNPAPRLVVADVGDPAHLRVVRSVALPEGSRPTGVAIGPEQIIVVAQRAGLFAFHRDGP